MTLKTLFLTLLFGFCAASFVGCASTDSADEPLDGISGFDPGDGRTLSQTHRDIMR